jgi:hypothetical protein
MTNECTDHMADIHKHINMSIMAKSPIQHQNIHIKNIHTPDDWFWRRMLAADILLARTSAPVDIS